MLITTAAAELLARTAFDRMDLRLAGDVDAARVNTARLATACRMATAMTEGATTRTADQLRLLVLDYVATHAAAGQEGDDFAVLAAPALVRLVARDVTPTAPLTVSAR